MVFSTRASHTPRRHRRLTGWLWLALILAWPVRAEFQVEQAATTLTQSVYTLDARIDMAFSEEALEALRNGVPLTVVLDIEVTRQRRWWLDATVAHLEQRYRIWYHALSDQYLLRNLNSSAHYGFQSLGRALEALGTIEHLPLLDEELVDRRQRYEVSLRARLDIEELPSPLRPLAYVSPSWRLTSPWYTWPLQP